MTDGSQPPDGVAAGFRIRIEIAAARLEVFTGAAVGIIGQRLRKRVVGVSQLKSLQRKPL